MQFPQEVGLRPSRALMASVLVAHVAAALALFHVPLPRLGFIADEGMAARIGLSALAWGVLLISLWRALHAERRKRGLVLWLEADGLVEICAGGAVQGRLHRIRPHSAVVLDWALWFRLESMAPRQESGATDRGAPQSIMLLAWNVQGDGWRRLRIWLLHRGDRSPPAADPAQGVARGG